MTLPLSEIQNLSPSAVLEMFVLDATALGGSVYRFHPGTNGLGTSLIWQGQTYAPFPIIADGFQWSSKGTLPRPHLKVAALDGVVGGLTKTLNDLVGATVTYKRTLAKYIDAANFSPAVNANADPTACWPDEPWFIEQKVSETSDMIEFELCAPLDAQNAKIPKRRVTANVCGWNDSSVCIYSVGGACGKRLADCKTKWGATADLPFGAFPGTARLR